MFTKNLFHCLFGLGSTLTKSELSDISNLFRQYTSSEVLQAAIIRFGSKKLGITLYHMKYFTLTVDWKSYFHYSDEDIKASFAATNRKFRYFSDVAIDILFPIYRFIYLVCDFIDKLFNSTYSTAPFDYAYKLILLYGNNYNIEDTFNAFDQYCIENNLSTTSLTDKLGFPLREDEDNTNADLPTWRTIVKENGIKKTWPLFYIAKEIRHILGRAPANMEEAKQAALTIEYKQAALNALVAIEFKNHFIPEKLFDEYVSMSTTSQTGTTNNLKMLKSILTYFNIDKRFDVLMTILDINKIVAMMVFNPVQDEIISMLPFQQQNDFRQVLFAEEEKLSKDKIAKIKHFIERTNFSMGLFGSWVGEHMQLDGGKSKLLPSELKQQLDHIKAAESNKGSFSETWKEVYKMGCNTVKSKSCLSFFSKSDAKVYTDLFTNNEPLNAFKY